MESCMFKDEKNQMFEDEERLYRLPFEAYLKQKDGNNQRCIALFPESIFCKYSKDGINLIVYKGDISQLKVDAIVCSSDSTFIAGNNIGQIIHNVAGRNLLRECSKLGYCEVGNAKSLCNLFFFFEIIYYYFIHIYVQQIKSLKDTIFPLVLLFTQ
jgi:hypothetical protein